MNQQRIKLTKKLLELHLHYFFQIVFLKSAIELPQANQTN